MKQVIILRYLHDYSQEEVAQILHIPIGTVKSRIHAALKTTSKRASRRNLFRRGRECEMSLDCRVRESIREEAKGIVAPPELKEKVIVQIKMNQGGRKRKKHLIAGVLAAAF